MNRSGFTLLELSIVLVIIAVMTHLAVREAGKFTNMNRRRLANQQLESLRDAVIGKNSDFESGFFADMGRLPRAVQHTNANGSVSFSLAELWLKPAGAGPYAVLQATAENIADGDTANSDPNVYVPCGWRGPYIRLPMGTDRLRDPWGNPYESPDETGGKHRLRGVGGTDIVAAESAIAAFGHLGSDGLPDSLHASADAETKDCLVTNAAETATSLVVAILPIDSDGAAKAAAASKVCVYGPCGDPVSGATKLYVRTATGTDAITVTGLKPGPHAVKVNYNMQNIWPAQNIVLKPGANYHAVKLSVPDNASTEGDGA